MKPDFQNISRTCLVSERLERRVSGGTRVSAKPLTQAQQELFAQHTPKDFVAAGYGYLPFLEAPSEPPSLDRVMR
jgi:hypothetical protein